MVGVCGRKRNANCGGKLNVDMEENGIYKSERKRNVDMERKRSVICGRK